MTKSKWETVPDELGGYLKRKVVSDDLVLELWHHPQWSPALKALQKGNARPIGKLLRGGGPVPEEIATALGTILDPTPAYKGTRLEVCVPKRWTTRQLLWANAEKRKVRREIEIARTMAGGKLDAALESVANKRKAEGKPHSRRYLLNCWKMDDREIVRNSQRILGLLR